MAQFFSAFQSIGPLFLVIFVGMMVSRNKSVDSLGLFMGKQPFGKFREWLPVLAFSVVILFVLPLLFFLTLKPFTDLQISRTWILEAAMPMGLTAYALCMKYELNTGFASRVVVLSTLLALLSLPFWLVFLN